MPFAQCNYLADIHIYIIYIFFFFTNILFNKLPMFNCMSRAHHCAGYKATREELLAVHLCCCFVTHCRRTRIATAAESHAATSQKAFRNKKTCALTQLHIWLILISFDVCMYVCACIPINLAVISVDSWQPNQQYMQAYITYLYSNNEKRLYLNMYFS